MIKMKKYSKEFKEEALRLSDEVGLKKAASQLGLNYYTIADWHKVSQGIVLTMAEWRASLLP